MVKLIPMDPADFPAYLESSIRDYAVDKIRSGQWKESEAIEKSRAEYARYLPDGLDTKDQFIYSIVDESNQQKLGVLWVEVKMDESPRTAFGFDFIIDEPFRGKGFGKQALQALDWQLISMGVASMGLHVFGHNATAFNLYKKMGFEITNINMRKMYK
jgi:ribosomal protein S18 acetylase RimI-like enzyme